MSRALGALSVESSSGRALSPRESEILERRLRGEPLKNIAHDLRIGIGTASQHQQRALEKVGLETLDDARERLAPALSESLGLGLESLAETMGGMTLSAADERELRSALAETVRGVARGLAVLDRARKRARGAE